MHSRPLCRPFISALCIALAWVALLGCRGAERETRDARRESAAPIPQTSEDAGAREGLRAPSVFSLAAVTTPGKVELREGAVTLVMFWATWNSPCKKAFPKLQELYERYETQGFSVTAISIDDDRTSVREFATETGAKFPVGWDEGHKVANLWQPANVPTFYLVSRHLRVIQTYAGYHEADEEVFNRSIVAALREK
jgi:thiol-disulfide isomerase/thioredoxin